MRPQRKKPQKGNPKTATWSNERLKGGGAYNGWKAGLTEWVHVHHVGVSKPCFDTMTDGVVPCPYCKPQCRRDWIGYVPVYDVGGKRLLAIVQDYSELVVDRIPVYAPVTVRRGEEPKDPITVTPSKWTADPYARLKTGENGVDIWDALLILWNQPLLSSHFGLTSDKTVTPPAEPEEPPEPIDPELLKRCPNRITPELLKTAGEIIQEQVGRITHNGRSVSETHRNGKPPPPSD